MPRNRKAKNGSNGKGQKQGATRSEASKVLAQGVGAVPKRAFGMSDAKTASLACWDARLPAHLGLPRAVGPYTTIRTTKRFSATSTCCVFGTFQSGGQTITGATSTDLDGSWSTVCCVRSINGAATINNAVANAYALTSPLSGLGSAVTLCPSGLSVQIMNPEALQTTAGVVYAGVMHTQAKIGGRAENWESYFDKFVEYQAPRMMSAGKLALRGVQINSYPLNMTEVSKFSELTQDTDQSFVYGEGQPEAAGWAPILVYNPSGIALEYIVTSEWRVRFDLDHPASSSHTYHHPASDMTWATLTRKAAEMGAGAIDIADTVANMGQLATAGLKAIRGARSSLALTAEEAALLA